MVKFSFFNILVFDLSIELFIKFIISLHFALCQSSKSEFLKDISPSLVSIGERIFLHIRIFSHIFLIKLFLDSMKLFALSLSSLLDFFDFISSNSDDEYLYSTVRARSKYALLAQIHGISFLLFCFKSDSFIPK